MAIKHPTQTTERLEQREQQMRQAEELLGSLPQTTGIAKGLFHGRFIHDWVFPYPTLSRQQSIDTKAAVADLNQFCDQHLDPTAIDRNADIPRHVIDGLADLGLLGMTAPASFGGRGFSQKQYCRLLEVIGARCSSTSIFVNAHHSIGMRGLLLFGTEAQKQKWLPDLVSGKKLAAFALTEPDAGSDASNVQTTATPTGDGATFVLNGQKRYITNGAIADVLTVMARTPVDGTDDTAITAFLVTPDMPGFRVTEPRMEKLGIRGTATAKLAFDQLHVPRENILGPYGKGLKVALTVLDFGRTTFGACCTGAAKTCLRLAIDHARTRRQFGRSLAEFELVQQKLARMAAWIYAMEATTNVTAGLIDRGLEDYMLETAMLKVWSTERLWTIVNDAFQIYGGAAYFTDQPLERMLRDHRINQIGEGANEVLMSFIALTGMRGPGMQMKEVNEAMKHPLRGFGSFAHFAIGAMRLRMQTPDVPLDSEELKPMGRRLGKQVKRLGTTVQSTLVRHREEVLERQLVLERIAWIAMELFATACTLSRLDSELVNGDRSNQPAAQFFIADSRRHVDHCFAALRDNDDDRLLATAQSL
ncbi:acyl-CoA dehydrogenase [Rhodopirellula maiorica SM1]|uniref:Acyl-CoA dehydrogenase n=1 Tax=Rhodopirellula maiorica SM1 TaxID=1265738 RepID=M5S6S6_9BACT|nr:acyl-CoA dehydrogenase family protein [Rhodopirellula maiorica]EMI21884.1 acyl-CoA dehydrogenase [Rhodopirellula maiorica SM1]